MLWLFDIDGTLISSGEAGTRSLNRAFHTLFGVKDAFRGIKMAGKTDIQIMKEGLVAHGIPPTQDNLDAMVQMYLRYLQSEIENPWRRLMPGVREFLEHLTEKGHPTGLLTGNLQDGARIKLSPFGLNPYFPTGAFGSDHEERDALLTIALRRSAPLLDHSDGDLTPQRCIVVGDTPRDVRCAKVHGAWSLGVCTGPYDRESLLRAGADLVVEDLSEMEVVLEFVEEISADVRGRICNTG